MRVCDYCREPRAITEIFIPDYTFYQSGKLMVSYNKHEICRECALSLAEKVQEWIKESKHED